ncbi:MAG: glycerophosphodiester phosphodiesterase [Spirochaetia bacterium]|nr:glycerophosphodiester phosphodiesterase [Spirochaetia bacterium]
MDAATRPLVIAHRGFRSVAPENTLAAFSAAFDSGAAWIELDVAASSDGELVVIHDDALDRTTDARSRYPDRGSYAVYDWTLGELRSLDAGSWFAERDPFGRIARGDVARAALEAYRGERIPTLRECLVLARERGGSVNVEIKDATGRACDAWIVERSLDLIRGTGMADRVLLSSFNHDYLRRSRKVEPGIPIGALVEKVAPADPVRMLRELGAYSYHPGMDILDREAARAVREAGYGLMVWTVNEVADLERMVEWGATGLFTDFQDRAFAVLAG